MTSRVRILLQHSAGELNDRASASLDQASGPIRTMAVDRQLRIRRDVDRGVLNKSPDGTTY
jgi:hypothetical protein